LKMARTLFSWCVAGFIAADGTIFLAGTLP